MGKKLFIILFLFFLAFLACHNSNAQTYTIVNDVHWSTQNQNMWGPNGNPWSINQIIDLFHIDYDTTVTFGYMDTILGIQTGALFTLDTWLMIGSTFAITGFTTGWVDVNYPVRITLTFPNNYTWNPGQIVTINSEYEVLPGWYLHSQFPQAGEVYLDLDFGFDLDLDAEVCLGGCTTFDIIDVSVPADSIVIFYINGQTGEVIYPCWNGTFFDFCHDTLLPITFTNLAGIGLSGEITLPYIETHDWLDTSDPCSQTIYAQGDSTWIYLELDVIQFLYAIAGVIPPPQGPAIQQFLSMLSGTYSMGGGITIDYTLLDASFELESTMQQDLTFAPTVWSTLSFPTAVEYVVNNPHNGYAVLDSGFTDTISFPACSDLNFRWPCFNWPTMDVGIEHSITPTFTNHTWDSIAFSFILTALEFDINVPFPKIMPEVEVPKICIDAPVSCNKRDKEFSCTDQICMPGITHPSIDSLNINELKGNSAKWTYHIGPLIDLSLPLGYIPLTWYNNTWELDGFHDTIVQGTQMAPNPEMNIIDINGNDVLCAGDSSGNVSIEIEYGTPPYTYDWSTGYSNTTNLPTDTLYNASAGTYYVTVYDVNGCSLTDQFTLIEVNPPIFIDLTGNNVLCTGDSTGSIISSVSGGTPPYGYTWGPLGGTGANANNIPAGLYTLTVTDAVGCTETDTISITEPATALNVVTDSIEHILCFGGTNGSISITASGGTPGYAYQWNTGYWADDIFNIPAGIYTVTISDANGCTFTITETVTEPPLLETFINGTNISCHGFADGEADLNVSGGTVPYSYLWSTGDATEDLSGLIAGTYAVTVTDANGCSSSSTITLNEPLAPLTATYEPTHVLCYGDSTGAINLSAFGGTMPYSYLWNTGQTSEDLINIPAGTYVVTITDLHTCDTIVTIDIIQPSAPLSLDVIGTDVNCHGEDNGFAVSNVSGGTPSYYYEWNTGSVNPNIDQLISGWYILTVTDDHGCTITDSTFIDEPDELIASTDTSVVICIGDTINLLGSATGGTPPYTSYWSNGQNTEQITVHPVISTSYSYYVIDSRGCISNVSTVDVLVNPPLSLQLFADDYYVCPGDPVTLSVHASGGDGNYSFVLNDSLPIWLPNDVYPSESTSYAILMSDGCGTPPVQDVVHIGLLQNPPNSVIADTLSGCQPLTVHFSEVSPDMGQSYAWDFGDINSSNYSGKKSPVHTFNDPGIYNITLTVSSDSGCTTTDTFDSLITVYEVPFASFIPDPRVVNVIYPLVYFNNQSSGANYCYWFFGDGDSSHFCFPEHIYPDIPGIYHVELIAESEFGCRDTAFNTVEVKGAYTFYAPTAFSPDYDGINDYFFVRGTGIDNNNFQLFVFDRWGEVVYESDNIYESWDGSVKGNKIAKVGAYAWYAVFKDDNGLGHEESGSVTIIR